MRKLQSKKRDSSTENVAPSITPLQPSVPVKRGPGRPRKNTLTQYDMAEVCSGSASYADAKKMQGTDAASAKALVTFRRAIADAEKLLMTPADFDGGGTAQDGHIVSKESLQKRVARRLNVVDRFLTDDKLIELLSFSNLKEVGIYEGILLDKSQVLSGQPNVIIGSEDRNRINEVMPRLMSELKRRGLITTVSERKVEFRNAGLNE